VFVDENVLFALGTRHQRTFKTYSHHPNFIVPLDRSHHVFRRPRSSATRTAIVGDTDRDRRKNNSNSATATDKEQTKFNNAIRLAAPVPIISSRGRTNDDSGNSRFNRRQNIKKNNYTELKSRRPYKYSHRKQNLLRKRTRAISAEKFKFWHLNIMLYLC
jgi:hypothetical protein